MRQTYGQGATRRVPARAWFIRRQLGRDPLLRRALVSARRVAARRPDVSSVGIGWSASAGDSEARLVVRTTGPVDEAELGIDGPVEVQPRRGCAPAAVQQSGLARWPTAGEVTPGAWMTFGRFPVPEASGVFENGVPELGTVGTVFKLTVDGSIHATTAGHVFTEPCRDRFSSPSGPRPMGVIGRDWLRVPNSIYFPSTLLIGSRIRDAMLFEVPDDFRGMGKPSWPEGFQGRFASGPDLAIGCRGFMWVERMDGELKGRHQKLPIRLADSVDFLSKLVSCGPQLERVLRYGFAWEVELLGEPSEGGDSGSPVFVEVGDEGEVRLLGLHFLRDRHWAYSVDAETFFLATVGEPDVNFRFLGF